ncbi:ATP-dependent RNA helicase DHX30-like [Daktulosphaira vitifoliae]|uniref:ATP-dependent RNA helicase DHX30-like n=1 Tax=Daktulosphaira vitifoliae TaxID=58002 RepID=UPI0021AAEEDA|nr:ATP-dependent RNA helicase DHX30-like [Daktulosphaira vitifoliae]
MLCIQTLIGVRKFYRVPSTLFIRKLAVPQTSIITEPYIISEEDIKKLRRTFTSPRNVVSNYFNQVERSSQVKKGHSFSFQKKKNEWNCQLNINWPNHIAFTSAAISKTKAAEIVSLKAIKWLQEMNQLDKKGKPILVTEKQRLDIAHSPVTSIDLNEKDIILISNLFKKYRQEVLPVINEDTNENVIDNLSEDESLFVLPKFSHTDYNLRNKQLYNKYMKKSIKILKLPIDDYKESILEIIQNNQVTIIKGEPGCGKSTRVPQFIIEQWSEDKKGADCNIYITQPRRISAITLAQRVADERSELLGDVVGYQVRLNQILPKKPGSIVFASSGILLQKLQTDPELKEFSHVIIDEAHEQDINTEILLMLTKNALKLNKNLKLIIMSATLDAKHFQRYYGNNAKSISIPGATYPVKINFLSEIFLKELGIGQQSTVEQDNGRPFWNPILVAKVINWIDKRKPPGAILCFISGWQDIIDVSKILQNCLNSLEIKFAHSKLTPEKQIEIMKPAKEGKRKVVLATNIAETSITINDIVYVVDTGMQNVSSWSANKGIKYLDRSWVSQANAIQRRGRAGRTQPGECYHLFSLERFNQCSEYPIPEIQMTPLEHTVLNLKIHSNEKARSVLSKLLNPPNLENIDGAVAELKLLGALDKEEGLTALGKRIAAFPFDPSLSKALVNSVFFKCLDSTLTIITYLSSNINIFKDATSVESRMIKKKYSENSDHLAVARIYSKWNKIQSLNKMESIDFCKENFLSEANLVLIFRLRKLFIQNLFNSMLIDNNSIIDCDVNSLNSIDLLLPAVLVSGFGNLVFKRFFMRSNGQRSSTFINDTGIKVIMHSESVNYNKAQENELLTYYREGRTLDHDMAMLNKTTYIHPILAVLFFNGPVTFKHDGVNNCIIYLKNKKRINLLCSKGDWQNLMELRQIIRSLVDYLMKTYGHNEITEESDEVILNFRDSLCSVLNSLVNKK